MKVFVALVSSFEPLTNVKELHLRSCGKKKKKKKKEEEKTTWKVFNWIECCIFTDVFVFL